MAVNEAQVAVEAMADDILNYINSLDIDLLGKNKLAKIAIERMARKTGAVKAVIFRKELADGTGRKDGKSKGSD